MLSRKNYGGTIWSKPGGPPSMHFTPTISPVNTGLKTLGATRAQWPGASQFHGAMRQFGMDLQSRQLGTQLPLVKHGQLPSSAYQNGLRHAYDYVRSGGTMNADGSYFGQQPGGGNLTVVEKTI